MPIGAARAAQSGGLLDLPAGVYTDNFSRTNGPLGTSPDGLVWEVVSGSFSISSNRATSSTAISSNPLAVLSLARRDIDLSLSVGLGGDALYFRVVDASNWWRVRTFWSQSTSTITEYEWFYDYGTAAGHTHGSGAASSGTTWSTSNSSCPVGSSVSHGHAADPFNHTHPRSACYTTGNTRSAGTTTTNTYIIYLEKNVAGTVSTVASSTQQASTLSVDIAADGTFMWGGSTASLGPISDATHASSRKHGIGRGTSSVNSSSLDNFTATVH